jgi:hypothetical protein
MIQSWVPRFNLDNPSSFTFQHKSRSKHAIQTLDQTHETAKLL